MPASRPFVVLLCVLVLTAAAVAAPGPSVRFAVGDVSEATVAEAERVWRASAPKVAALVWPNVEAPAPILAELLSTAQFRERTAGLVGDWGVGLASDEWLAVDVGRMRAVGQTLGHVLMHELAHCLMHQALKEVRGVPRWFHEGVAQHVAGEWRFRDTVALVVDGGVLRLSELRRSFPGGAGGADRAYRTSLLAVRQLEERHGADVVRVLIAAAARTREFPQAFREVTGVELGRWETDFASRTELRYGWLMMLARWPTLFVAMSLVFAVGAALKIRRDRRRLAEMPDDEVRVPDLEGPGRPH